MSTLTEPLRCLLKQDVAWHWGHEQNKSIERVLLSEQAPRYFDISKEVSLQVEASKFGLGAVLLQEGQPFAYASRALTTTEVNTHRQRAVYNSCLAVNISTMKYMNNLQPYKQTISLCCQLWKNHCIEPHHECNDYCCACSAMRLALYPMYLANIDIYLAASLI